MAKPEISFRIGACSASVFVNESESQTGEARTFRSVTLQRRYRDGTDWKTSTSFTLADLPNALETLRLACDHVADKEAVSQSEEQG